MSALIRHSTDWYAALDRYIESRKAMPFSWATNDCCSFAADWVLTATGRDAMADLRGMNSAIKAHRALDEAGGMLVAVDARMGAHIAGPFAQAGDVAMVMLESGAKGMTICTGADLMIPSDAGLVALTIDRAEAVWRV